MPGRNRRSSHELPTIEKIGEAEGRLRADGILHTRLKGRMEEPSLKSLGSKLVRHLDGPHPVDWILDFTGITEVDGQLNETLRTVLVAFKAHANGRHVTVIVNDVTRLLVTSSCFGANAGATFTENLEQALVEMERRREERL